MGMESNWWQATDEEIAQLEADPDGVYDLFESDVEGFSLDKAWNGIHFLLTGTQFDGEGPLASVLFGRPLGDYVEDGSIACHALTSADVRAFDDALSMITPDELARRFDPRAMMEADVYPEIWEEALTGSDGPFEYLVEYFEDLRKGVRAAREKGVGLITFVA